MAQSSYDRGMGGLGGGFSPLGLTLVKVLMALFVAELLAWHWFDAQGVLSLLFLYPWSSPAFAPWQWATHILMQDAGEPVAFLFELLTLWFLGAAVEARLGRKGFLTLYFGTAYLASLPAWLLTSLLPLAAVPYGGLAAPSLAVLTAFCLLNRGATLLLFFVLPVRAVWLLTGTVAFVSLTFLAKANPNGLYHLATMALAWAYIEVGGGGPRRWWLKWKEWRARRRLSQLRVVPGGRDADREIMYH